MAMTANATSELFINELPSVSALTSSKDVADTFIDLRKWVEKLHSHGRLIHAGEHLNLEHRLAMLTFLEREAAGGLRRKVAKKLSDILNHDGTWATAKPGRSASFGIENASSTKAESEEAPVSRIDQTGVFAGTACRESAFKCQLHPDKSQGDGLHTGLPSLRSLMGRDSLEDPQEEFDMIRHWVQTKKRQKILADAWAPLSAEYRSEIKKFLDYFGGLRSVFREQAREVLKWISTVDISPDQPTQAPLDAKALLSVQPISDTVEDENEFANLSQWIMNLADTDLAAAGVGLPVAARRDIFEIILRACRRRPCGEVRKVISKLLRSEAWNREGLLDTTAFYQILDESLDAHELGVTPPAKSASPAPHRTPSLGGA